MNAHIEAGLSQSDAFLRQHPEVQAVVDALSDPIHARNSFVFDVIDKLRRYGSISQRQIDAIVASMQRDVDFASRPADVKIPAPTGKGVEVVGEVVKAEWKENQYGVRHVMTVKVSTPSGIWLAWGTMPAGLGAEKGQRVAFVANLERSDSDASFAFFQRPRLARVLEQAVA